MSNALKVVIFTVLLLSLSIGWVGCASEAESQETGGGILIRLDKGDEDRLLEFYLGGYLGETARNPEVSGLIQKRHKSWYLLDPTQIPGADTTLKRLVAAGGSDRVIEWDEFEVFVSETYYLARSAPPTIERMKLKVGDWHLTDDWRAYEVEGTMSPFRRKIWIRTASLMAAIRRMNSFSDPILYDEGTVFVGEHLVDGAVVETTFMLKRADGFWDYFAYDEMGDLATEVQKEPENMQVPVKCIGCHYGDRQFEPERSFPAQPRPGPNGPRTIFTEEGNRSVRIASDLQEHAKRSDTILGLYATLYLSGVSTRIREGEATVDEIDMMQRLGFAE